jgi:hypothetical protein
MVISTGMLAPQPLYLIGRQLGRHRRIEHFSLSRLIPPALLCELLIGIAVVGQYVNPPESGEPPL